MARAAAAPPGTGRGRPRIRRRGLAMVTLGLVAVAVLAPAAAAARPHHGPSGRSPSPAFAWLVPRRPPPSWHQLVTPTTGATLSYPPSFASVTGDPGSVSAAVRTSEGFIVAYLNATPRQGAEAPHGFAAFRVHLLGEDHDVAVREEAEAEGLAFQGGRGSCVIDSYVTRVQHRQYREVACLVVGTRATTVVVAAALTTSWTRFQSLLRQSVAAFAVS